ncbi:DUF5684 domain-containing protein [Clostridium sp. MD294]|uniref:DUF5684 domain-containing protein n=1 Tax=Clostridium sp. MD294 TaxID=97138 RepID=UPI0002CC5EF2|nr:DUF5684 domain-containing protein [Clostridium sp. MD294]NDO46716.1 hypothetical protein [Clostridium sp. MD294]USF28845.1 hypothetical protein C820_000219 [Clostridium sp. MD294]
MFDVDMLSTVFKNIDADAASFLLDIVNPDIAFIISRFENISVVTVMILFLLLGMWKTFEKAGKPGFIALIPLYNCYKLYQIAFGSGWFFLLGMIPLANIIVRVVFGAKLAEAFGKNEVFGAILSYFPFIFYMILGFGKSNCVIQRNKAEKEKDFDELST